MASGTQVAAYYFLNRIRRPPQEESMTIYGKPIPGENLCEKHPEMSPVLLVSARWAENADS